MKEAISRRFKRGGLQELADGGEGGEGKFASFPDLVLIDGGKGQLNAALQVRAELELQIPFLALAERREEIYLAGRGGEPVLLPADSPGLLLLRKIRDEAHRFALAYHRNLRGKSTRGSVLDEIPGVGPKRKKELIKHFGSVKKNPPGQPRRPSGGEGHQRQAGGGDLSTFPEKLAGRRAF